VRIHVIEDHRSFVDALTPAIEADARLELVSASYGLADGVAAARKDPPDVLLMDIGLPDGDGVQGCREVKGFSPTTQVVMLTASHEDAVLVAAIDAGCSGFITKDRPLVEVIDALLNVAEGEMIISPDMLNQLLPRLHRGGISRPGALTPREIEILMIVREGGTNASIAEGLRLSVHTVRNNVQNILRKLGAHSKLEAIAEAVRQGIIPR